MKFRVTLIICLLMLPIGIQAEQVPAAFVDIGYGARPLGMGGAFVAISDDANSVLWNPAGLSSLVKREVTFMYTNQKGLIPYHFLAYGHPLKNGFSVGGGIIQSGDKVLSETTFILSCGISFKSLWRGVRADSLDLGVSLKLRFASFGGNPDGGENRVKGDALGFAADLGGLWEVNDFLTLGILLRDLIAPVYWNSSVKGEYREDIPRAFILGAKFQLGASPVFGIILDNFRKVYVGIEKNIFKYFDVRLGYRQDLNFEVEEEYTVGLGFGEIRFGGGFSPRIDVSYGFERLEDTFRLSSSFQF